MEWQYVTLIGIIALSVITITILMLRYLNSCTHSWKQIEVFGIFKKVNGEERQVGMQKVYECEYCMKMKKEEVRING